MLKKSVIVLLLLFSLITATTDVTFKNVTFWGYSQSTETKKTIPLSNSLKDFLLELDFDKIEFIDQNIPVLYEDSLADLDKLNVLVLRNCGIYKIQPGILKNVTNLRTFSLKENRIEEIKEGVFNNLQLSTIDLSGNRISNIHRDAFNNLPSLVDIDLSNNNIQKWNKHWFKNTPVLRTLFLRNNSIATLPNNAFKNFMDDKYLGDEKLPISIFLSCNKIKKIKRKAFRGLREVKHLYLDHNWLESFDGDLLDGVLVANLRLDHNIGCCPNTALIRYNHLMDIYCNPFICRSKSEAKKKHKHDCSVKSSEEDPVTI